MRLRRFFMSFGKENGFAVDHLGWFDPDIFLGSVLVPFGLEYDGMLPAWNPDDQEVPRIVADTGLHQRVLEATKPHHRSRERALVFIENISPQRPLIDGEYRGAEQENDNEDGEGTESHFFGQITILMTIFPMAVKEKRASDPESATARLWMASSSVCSTALIHSGIWEC